MALGQGCGRGIGMVRAVDWVIYIMAPIKVLTKIEVQGQVCVSVWIHI